MKYPCSKLILPAVIVSWLVFAYSPCNAAPSNDDLANAQVIPSGSSFSVPGTDIDATQESFEFAFGYPIGVSQTVWYAWTPTVTGPLQFTAVREAGLTDEVGIFEGGEHPGHGVAFGKGDQHPLVDPRDGRPDVSDCGWQHQTSRPVHARRERGGCRDTTTRDCAYHVDHG